MSFKKLLDHTCDIYHIVEQSVPLGFHLPTVSSFDYHDKADIHGAMCHFGGASSSTMIQKEPMNQMEPTVKLALLIGTDIRLNDKIVDCATHQEYTAGLPRNIRNHHIVVELQKAGIQRFL